MDLRSPLRLHDIDEGRVSERSAARTDRIASLSDFPFRSVDGERHPFEHNAIHSAAIRILADMVYLFVQARSKQRRQHWDVPHGQAFQ